MTMGCCNCGKTMDDIDNVYYLEGWDNYFCSVACLMKCVYSAIDVKPAYYFD